MRAICCATVELEFTGSLPVRSDPGEVCTFFLSSFLSPANGSISVCIWGSSCVHFHCAYCGMAHLFVFPRALVVVGWGGGIRERVQMLLSLRLVLALVTYDTCAGNLTLELK